MDELPDFFEDFFLEPGDAVGFDSPPLTSDLVRTAEAKLEVKLPSVYLLLLGIQNGGYVTRPLYPTTRPTSWADDHVYFDHLLGIGGDDGIDAELGSRHQIETWGYPDVGVVICSSGSTAFMLDYEECGRDGEPRVIWVDTDTSNEPDVLELAPNFVTFVSRLQGY